MWLEPLTLRGGRVRLEPLSLAHHEALCAVGLEPSLWRWTTSSVRTPDDMRVYIEAALRAQKEGTALPFVTVDLASRKVIGSTRFAAADFEHRRVEIGWTWIAPPFQRTPVNTEAKYLMLRQNERSRTALLRIGAREEGILRRHMVTQGGRLRDTVYYSIILEEWPEVRQRLESWLARPWQPRA